LPNILWPKAQCSCHRKNKYIKKRNF
jgi:hypothetical protein